MFPILPIQFKTSSWEFQFNPNSGVAGRGEASLLHPIQFHKKNKWTHTSWVHLRRAEIKFDETRILVLTKNCVRKKTRHVLITYESQMNEWWKEILTSIRIWLHRKKGYNEAIGFYIYFVIINTYNWVKLLSCKWW